MIDNVQSIYTFVNSSWSTAKSVNILLGSSWENLPGAYLVIPRMSRLTQFLRLTCFSAFLCLFVASSSPSCSVDLTTHGLPACAQACPEWCWATVIGEMKEYYRFRSLSATEQAKAAPMCNGLECKVVSDVRKQACCTASTECNPSRGAAMGCGNPSSAKEITQGFQNEVPSKSWVHLHGNPGYSCKPGDGCWPSQDQLQNLLMSGSPVARATHGHITVVAGCRQTGDLIEYRVLDSLKNPNVSLWMNWTILTLGPPPGVRPFGDGPWQNSWFVNETSSM